ncbi:MAG: YhbD family protein [Coriobacteriia bacterium]|nr:YhbD family protein [Coriobacteriia bacterium]
MDTGLISKKDLLKDTGISYGQLYRWKRKKLIPEEWFIRKSTFTGQQTYFPRDRILVRIERILDMKDEDLSLDDIAEAVAPDLGGIGVTLEAVVEEGLASPAAVSAFQAVHPDSEALVFGELLSLYLLDRLLATGELSLEESRTVLATLEEGHAAFEGREYDLVCIRRMGVAVCLLVSSSAEIGLESGARLVARMNVQECVEALGARL